MWNYFFWDPQLHRRRVATRRQAEVPDCEGSGDTRNQLRDGILAGPDLHATGDSPLGRAKPAGLGSIRKRRASFQGK